MLSAEGGREGGDEGETGGDTWKEYLNSMVAAVVSFDEDRLEEIYNGALSLYPISVVTQKLLTPLLIELGLRWESSEGSIAEEHFFAFYLRNKLLIEVQHNAPAYPDMVGSTKKKGPITLSCIRPHQTFTLGLSRSCSIATSGCSDPQMRTLCLFTLPHV